MSPLDALVVAGGLGAAAGSATGCDLVAGRRLVRLRRPLEGRPATAATAVTPAALRRRGSPRGRRAGGAVPHSRRVVAGWVLALTTAGWCLGGSAAAVLLGAAAVAGHGWLRSRERAELARDRLSWRRVLDDLAGALHAGATPAVALEQALQRAAQQPPVGEAPEREAGSIRAPFRSLGSARVPRTAALADAVALAHRVGLDPAETLAAAGEGPARLGMLWRLALPLGVPLADGVERLGEIHDAQTRGEQEREAAAAGPRAAARLLCAVPLAGQGLGNLAGVSAWQVLTTTRVGELCLVTGVGLLWAGTASLERLVTQAGRPPKW